MTIEIWKPIPQYPYEISNKGRVRRLTGGKGTRAGYILKPKLHKHGYWMYDLSRRNVVRRMSGNHLVCLGFHGKRPSKKYDAAHRDGDPKNNDPLNVYWATRKQNMADADRHGRRPRGNKHPLAKLSDAKVRAIRKARKRGVRYSVLSAKYGVTAGQIYNAANGITWGHVCTK